MTFNLLKWSVLEQLVLCNRHVRVILCSELRYKAVTALNKKQLSITAPLRKITNGYYSP